MFWENFYNLCLRAGKAPNTVAKEVGIASGTITKWKNENAVPREQTLRKLADYFSVTVDELLRDNSEHTNTANAEESPEKDKLSSLLETLSPEQLRQVADYVDFIISKRK